MEVGVGKEVIGGVVTRVGQGIDGEGGVNRTSRRGVEKKGRGVMEGK
ncbi:hypothetical protein [Staphylococcus saprophyticus]